MIKSLKCWTFDEKQKFRGSWQRFCVRSENIGTIQSGQPRRAGAAFTREGGQHVQD